MRSAVVATAAWTLLSAVSLVATAWPAPTAFASAELDRLYALEAVGILRAYDNMDGLFGDYVDQAYQELLTRGGRFRAQASKQADAVLQKSSIPYAKLIEDPAVLKGVAQALKVDTLVRTRILKEGNRYRATIDWLHYPKMEILASEEFVMADEAPGARVEGGITAELRKGLARVLKKIPILGQVTGREAESVTLNVGSASGIQPGDTLVVATLDEVKRHPLLNTVVDWRTTSTGRLTVESLDGGMVFARVESEDPGRQVARYQKLTQVIAAPPKPAETARDPEATARPDDPPRLGWAAGGLWIGSFHRQYSSVGGTVGKTGSAIFLGAKAEGQVWLNPNWFVELGLGYGFASLGQTDIATGAESAAASASVSAFQYRFNGGYQYLPTGSVTGPRGWLRLGYMKTSYTLPISPTEFTGGASFGGLFLGLGADLPLRDRYGALLSLDFGILPSTDNLSFTKGSPKSVTDVQVFLGGYYKLEPKLVLRAGVDVMSQTASFDPTSNLTHRVISFGPSVQTYF